MGGEKSSKWKSFLDPEKDLLINPNASPGKCFENYLLCFFCLHFVENIFQIFLHRQKRLRLFHRAEYSLCHPQQTLPNNSNLTFDQSLNLFHQLIDNSEIPKCLGQDTCSRFRQSSTNFNLRILLKNNRLRIIMNFE